MAKKPGSGGGGSGGGGSPGKALPELTVGDVTNTEGSSMTFKVTLDNASAKTITVNYATANGTALLADSDYTAVSDTLTFLPGETTKSITIATGDDLKYEDNETFLVNLTSPTNATIKDGQGVATLNNNDSNYQSVPLVTLYIQQVALRDGTYLGQNWDEFNTHSLLSVEAINHRYYSPPDEYTLKWTTHIGYELPANFQEATLYFDGIFTAESPGQGLPNGVTLNIYAYADDGIANGAIDGAADRKLVGTKTTFPQGPAFQVDLNEVVLNGLNESGGKIALMVEVMDLQPQGENRTDLFRADSFHLDILI